MVLFSRLSTLSVSLSDVNPSILGAELSTASLIFGTLVPGTILVPLVVKPILGYKIMDWIKITIMKPNSEVRHLKDRISSAELKLYF